MIRLVAVEAAGRRLGAETDPPTDRVQARINAVTDIGETASALAHYILTGRATW